MRAHGHRTAHGRSPVTRHAWAGAICGMLLVVALSAPSDGLAAARSAPSLYWTNYGVSGTGGTIGHASLTGTDVDQSLVKGASGPVGIVVHGGYVYWSNPGVDAGSPGTTIGRAKLDGTDVNQSFITGLNSPHSIVISGKHIYWASRYGNTIGRANLDGTGVDSSFITGAIGPWGVAISGHYIYWTNYGANGGSNGTTIGRADLDGTPRGPELHHRCSRPGGHRRPRPVHLLVEQRKQPVGNDDRPCEPQRSRRQRELHHRRRLAGWARDHRLPHLLVELRRAPRRAGHARSDVPT